MPDWVLRREAANPELVLLPLGPQGIRRRCTRRCGRYDLSQPYMAHVLRLSRTEPLRMLRGPSS